VSTQTLNQQIKNAICKAQTFLTKSGRPRLIISDNTDLSIGRPFDSPYVSAFILRAIKLAGAKNNDILVKQNIKYLLENMESFGVWKFSKEMFSQLPPDIDDTVCALTALKTYNIKIDYNQISKKLLNYRESKTFFYTWIINQETLKTTGKQNDIDIVVNVNALIFYNMLNKKLPSTYKFITSFVNKYGLEPKKLSLYYKEPVIFAYFLAKTINTKQNHNLNNLKLKIQTEAQKTLTSTIDPLKISLATSTLLDLKTKFNTPATINTLLKQQNQDGSWNQAVFFEDPAKSYYGSQAEVDFILHLDNEVILHLLKQNIKHLNNQKFQGVFAVL
jgi:hypothetical protein